MITQKHPERQKTPWEDGVVITQKCPERQRTPHPHARRMSSSSDSLSVVQGHGVSDGESTPPSCSGGRNA